jgi:outer membrane protein TolC
MDESIAVSIGRMDCAGPILWPRLQLVTDAPRALDQANARYQSGLVTYLEVVSTENAALTTRLTAVEIDARRFILG